MTTTQLNVPKGSHDISTMNILLYQDTVTDFTMLKALTPAILTSNRPSETKQSFNLTPDHSS